MTHLTRVVVVAVLAAAAPAAGQSRDAVEIVDVAVGFPAAPSSARNSFMQGAVGKDAAWTPVYVTLKCHRPYDGPGVLIVEAADSDEVPTRFPTAVPQLAPGQTETVIGYTRPGGRNDQMTVTVVGRAATTIGQNTFPRPAALEPAHMLYLVLGSSLDGAPMPGVAEVPEGEADAVPDTNARTFLAQLTRPDHLPNRWYGFDGADLVFLTTGDRDFTTALVGERDGRKAALAEWVRRGGNLVMSVGRNADLLAAEGELRDLLPMLPTRPAEMDVTRVAWQDGAAAEASLGPMSVTRLEARPGRTAQVLATGPRGPDGGEMPLVVRGAYGWGRVTLVAFDLEDKPLARWKSRKPFWGELANRAGPRVPPGGISGQYMGMMRGGSTEIENGAFATLINQMENFPGVPVISFGWVALFILIYIIIVGPLDYFFLKKVVKRLELTWVTFPLIVLTVSAIAYYAAYALKGSDLRINKYDVVDIDVAAKTTTGRTWFTLFSPRIQNYRVGVEPAWTASAGNPDVMVTWSGLSRQARQSLFRRSYDYLPEAFGLDGVPVQVWSTKGFQAQWSAPYNSGPPPFQADLRLAPGGSLIGTVTNALPDALENAFLIYGGGRRDPEVVALGTLIPGAPKPVSAQEPRAFSNWVRSPFSTASVDEAVTAMRPAPQPPPDVWFPVQLFFHDLAAGQAVVQNASLRDLDLSWRLSPDNRTEAILVATVTKLDGNAEEVTSGGANPSRLWLGEFPVQGARRPTVDGKMRQESCVRVVLPVAIEPLSRTNP